MDASALASAESWLYWIGIAKLGAALLVAAGVVVEFGTDWIARPYEKVVSDARQAEIAQLHKDAADANVRAAEAQLALQKFRAPRNLTPEQQERITEAVQPFNGTQYDVAVSPGDAEADRLMALIEQALNKAAWREIGWRDGGGLAFTRPGHPTAGLATVTDVIVAVPLDGQPELIPAAKALAVALNAEGIAAIAEDGKGMTNTNAKTLHVLVGWKR